MDSLIVDALAVYRLTHLVTEDTFPPVRAVRERIWRQYPQVGAHVSSANGWMIKDTKAVRWTSALGWSIRSEVEVTPPTSATIAQDDAVVVAAHPVGELIGCPWCASPWIAIGVLAARRFVPSMWSPLAKVLAASAVAGIAASHV